MSPFNITSWQKSLVVSLADKYSPEFFPDKLFASVIHKNVKLAESPGYGKPIHIYDRHSRGCKESQSDV